MEITPENITNKLLYDAIYEYLRKCGLDDNEAVNLALEIQSHIGGAAERYGGDTNQVPED
jgi:hypothetical protein